MKEETPLKKWILALAGLALVAGCGDSPEPPAQSAVAEAPTTATSPSTTSSAPAEPGEALAKGIVVHQCNIGGDLSNTITAYDPTSGSEFGSVSYTVPDTSGNTKGNAYCNGADSSLEDGRRWRTAFNEDFTKFFVSQLDPATNTSVIGYYEPNNPEFHQLSPSAGDFNKVDQQHPSYHVASERLYFWNYAPDGTGQLSSMTVSDGTTRVEPALEKPLDFTDSLYTPANAKKPVMVENDEGLDSSDDIAVNDAGTRAASVWTGAGLKIGPAGQPITLANETAEMPFDKQVSLKFGRPPSAVAFVNDKSVIFTDGQQIFRADVRSGQAVVTTIFENNNDTTEVANVTLSRDKQQIAFLSRTGDTVKLHTMSVTGANVGMIATFQQEVRILEFR